MKLTDLERLAAERMRFECDLSSIRSQAEANHAPNPRTIPTARRAIGSAARSRAPH